MLRAIVLTLALLPVPGAVLAAERAAEPAEIVDSDFAGALQALADGQPDDLSAAVAALGRSPHPRSGVVLEALADGALYLRRDDQRVVIAARDGREYRLTDAASGTALPPAGRRDVSRITANNALRAQIDRVVARAGLTHGDAAVRQAAVEGLGDDPSADTIALLRELLPGERTDRVRDAITTVIGLHDLRHGNEAERIEAVHGLAGNVSGPVRNALRALLDDPATPAHLRAAAADALTASERRLSRLRVAETLFFGLSMGSVLALAAIGLAITFGVMGVINMAHGELIMLGAYTTYVVQQLLPDAIGLSVLVAIPAAFLVAGAAGVVIERGVIRFLYGRPLETLLATFGVSLLLQQAVRSVFSPLNRSVITPEWMSGSWQPVAGLSLTLNRLYILGFCLAVFAALLLVLRHTRLGLEVRAVAQNRAMARAMGVRSEWVDALTFGLGSGIAGIAGVALSQLTNVGPNLGQAYIVDSFLVVVFGGVGNLWGTLVSGLSLGVANKFLEPMAGAVLAKILILVLVILFIQKRPQGLFPQRGRAAEL